MKSYKTLKGFFVKYKWRYLLGVIWLIIVDTVQLIVPQILRTTTNKLQSGLLDPKSLLLYAILILLTGFIVAAGRYFWRIYIQGNSRTLEYFLRNKLFRHLQTLSTSYFNTHKTGDLMAHATNDINAVRMALGQGVVMIVDSIFITILAFIMMIKTTNLKLTLIGLLTFPFIALIVSKFGQIIHKRFRIVQESFSNLTNTVQESFAGIRVVKSFVQEKEEINNFLNINNDNLDKNLNLVKVSGTFFPLIQFMASISFLIVLWYGGTLVIREEIMLGDFVAFNTYLGLLVWPMMAIGWVINLMQRGAASMDRINAILDEKPEIVDSLEAIELIDIKGNIQFKNVSFKYPNSNEYALKNVSFYIPEGKTLAIVGRTGSGKSTIVNLLLRLYDIENGEILIDDINIKNIKIANLRENISYVPQNNFLFSTTIADNIGFAFEEKISEDDIVEAAKMAEVYDNIVEFPEGFNTVLGERGVTLSGGQKQRVSIARAIIKKSPILVLDDSLSSVDTKTEEKILKNLEHITSSITTILISHRISTVKKADEIIVIDNGNIVETGNHRSLLKLKGLYYDMNEKQLLEEKISTIK